MPVLGGEADPRIVGISGWAINSGLSTQDVPFTHIFIPDPGSVPRWGDAEFQVVPDASYHSLLTDGNNSADPTSEFFPGKFGDIKGADYSAGVLGVETDQFLLPSLYRPKQGDRVAVFGRWIVDCGHPDFHTEIHPPLLTARAWTVNQLGACAKESMPNPSGVPSGYATCVRVIGRPYLDSQEFGDGSLPLHVLGQLQQLVCWGIPLIPDIVPCLTQMSALAHVLPKPFTDLQTMVFDVRPPPPPTHLDGSGGYHLVVQWHFTVRPGVVVKLTRTGSDGVLVQVVMIPGQYQQPAPKCHTVQIDPYRVSQAFDPSVGVAFGILVNTIGAGLLGGSPPRVAVLNRGLEARFCNAPAAVSSSDVNIHQVAYNALGENPDYSVDGSQPFPIYGFLNVGWVPNRVVVNPLAPFALIISNPTDGESFGPARNNQGAAGLSTDPINFRASAVGLPSQSLEWTDNGVHLGSGPSFSATLSAGSCSFEKHVIVATAKDASGDSASSSINVFAGQIC